MRERRHLLRQVLSKHLSLPLRQREMASGRWGVYLVRGEVTCGGGGQSTSLRSLTGSSCTMLRWFMARLKAIWTALRMLDVRPSIILILSMVLSMPRGTILDLGSHCLKRQLAPVRDAGALPPSRCWEALLPLRIKKTRLSYNAAIVATLNAKFESCALWAGSKVTVELTSCACCRKRARGRVSLLLCTASARRCGARPWGAWGWTPRCAGSPLAACEGR